MTLTDLIEALQKATGPDREIDRDIADTLGLGPDESWERPKHQRGIINMDVGNWSKGNISRSSPRYTSSVDAAIALAERVLPGRSVMMGWRQSSETRPWARVGLWPDPDATGATPAIALCVATLRALSALQAKEGMKP